MSPLVACIVCARPLDSLLTSGLHAGVAVMAAVAIVVVAALGTRRAGGGASGCRRAAGRGGASGGHVVIGAWLNGWLPAPASTHAARFDSVLAAAHTEGAIIFLSWLAVFAIILVRFRARAGVAPGPAAGRHWPLLAIAAIVLGDVWLLAGLGPAGLARAGRAGSGRRRRSPRRRRAVRLERPLPRLRPPLRTHLADAHHGGRSRSASTAAIPTAPTTSS